MATTVISAFETFLSNLEITDLQGSTVSDRQTRVRGIIKDKMDVIDDFLTGSYKRSTMIRPLKEADVDVFIVLDSDYFSKYSPRSLLDRVKAIYKDHYGQGVDISRNGQAVTISYTDFKVDIVPSFKRSGGGYLIPNSSDQSWIATNPKSHVEIWSEMNKRKDSRLVPVLKALKRWKNTKCNTIRSFHLETLAISIFQPVQMQTWRHSILYFFDKARTSILLNLSDPAPGFGGYVDSYLSYSQKQALVSPIETAYGRARKAIDFENADKPKDAIEQWKLIFGDAFPSYG